MIRSKKDYKYFLKADRLALGYPPRKNMMVLVKCFFFPDEILRFQKILRKLEYYKNCKNDPVSFIYRVFLTKKFYKLSQKLGFSIPLNVFDAGLNIAHYGTIIVNPSAKIGKNCRIHACTNIGTQAGYVDKAPVIGDNCYIGPGAKIYGKIIIANGSAIGANAVVNKSFTEENSTIVGVPAKKVGIADTKKILIRATEILENK